MEGDILNRILVFMIMQVNLSKDYVMFHVKK
jgi:hypothetical protein